jgi:hypothetical protein
MISLSANPEPAPDLLRRFVSTPHQTIWQIGQVVAGIESNSEEVLSSFPEAKHMSQNASLKIRIIVDTELRLAAAATPVALDGAEVLVGRAQQMLFAFDRESQEIFVFMSRFDRGTFIGLVLKLVCEYSVPVAAAAS